MKGRGNDFEIFVAVHKFEGGGRAYLNTDLPCVLMIVLFLFVLFFLSTAARPRLVLPLLLPHLFYPSSFFFIFLFFFSGLDLHCLASANKLSRGPPYVDPIVIIIVSTCAVRERAKLTLSFLLLVCALWHIEFFIQMHFISFL